MPALQLSVSRPSPRVLASGQLRASRVARRSSMKVYAQTATNKVVIVGAGWAGAQTLVRPSPLPAGVGGGEQEWQARRVGFDSPPDPPDEPDAGLGAAKHLAEQGYDVKLLDAAPNPGTALVGDVQQGVYSLR